ncbi:LmeA family phospholipid-binding protein [Streptomyces sp. cg35]|uniref:LmeA family phospholipid-binding protein n=1 Tax=Streptomyces sp. cg35 TaxID=3421650 RepID=UPI003D16FC0E
MRTLRRSLIVIAVLAAIFVGVDRLAVHLAEGQAVDKLRASNGFGESTQVSIKGFPFLTQAVAGDLDELDASVDHYESAMPGGATGRVENLELHLNGVEFTNGYSSAVARTATGTALVPYAELLHAAPAQDNGVRIAGLSDGGKGRIKVELETPDGGTSSIYSTVSVKDDTLRLHAETSPSTTTGLSEDELRKATDIQQSITRLPGGIRLTAAEPRTDGLRLTVGGSHVPLT